MTVRTQDKFYPDMLPGRYDRPPRIPAFAENLTDMARAIGLRAQGPASPDPHLEDREVLRAME